MKKKSIRNQYPNLTTLLKLVEKKKKVGWFHDEDYREHFRLSAGAALEACILDGEVVQVKESLIHFEQIIDELLIVRVSTSIISALFLAAKPTDLVKRAYKEFLHAVDHHAPNSMETSIRELLNNRLLNEQWFLSGPSLRFWNKFQLFLTSQEREQYQDWEISQGDYIEHSNDIIKMLKKWREKSSSGGYQTMLVKGVRRQRHKEIWLRTAFDIYGIGAFVEKGETGNRFSLRPRYVAWLSSTQKNFLKECEFIPALRDKQRWLEWHNVLCHDFNLETYYFYQRAEKYYDLSDTPFGEQYITVKTNHELLGVEPETYFANGVPMTPNEELDIHF